VNLLFTQTASTATVLTLIVTLILPIVVGLVTKKSTNPAIKAVLLIILSAATAIVSNLLAVKGTTDVWPIVQDSVFTAVIAIATLFGVWMPTTVNAKAQAVLVRDNPGA